MSSLVHIMLSPVCIEPIKYFISSSMRVGGYTDADPHQFFRIIFLIIGTLRHNTQQFLRSLLQTLKNVFDCYSYFQSHYWFACK